MEYLLGHDVGTSGDKAALITTSGEVVAKAYQPYPTTYPGPLRAEQAPEDLWQGVVTTTRRVLGTSGARPEQILGLSFSTQMVNVVLLDQRAQPLGPILSWLDGRAGDQARQVMRRLGGDRIFASIVGSKLTGKDLLPKYLWLKRFDSEAYARAASIVDVSGYILHRATGELAYEWTCASVTGLFDLKGKGWSRGLMRFFGLDPAKFPALVPSCEPVGGLADEAARQLGLLAGTPVIAGAGDAMAAAVGSGAVGLGEGHLNLGTSGFVGILSSKPATGRAGVVVVQSADRDKFLLIGEMETCGACLRWAARELYDADPGAVAFARMDQDAAAEAPGAGGLLFTPWMYGERSPIPDERIRAGFINLSASHRRSQMTRAVYEGVAYNLRWILDIIGDRFHHRPPTLRAVGGGARARPWLQILADVTGRTLETIEHPQEVSAFGAALLAGVGAGVFPSIESVRTLVPAGEVIRPAETDRPTYDRMYRAFRRIYPGLRSVYHDLNRAQEP
jgi:xylulokinase